MNEMTGNSAFPILAAAMYGFSAISTEMTLYTRFYALVISLLLVVIRIHQVMWRPDTSLLKGELLTFLSMPLIYAALRNSQLTLIFAGALVFVFLPAFS